MFDVRETTCLEAWRAGTCKVREQKGSVFNLMTEISDPAFFDPQWLDDYSPNSVDSTMDDIRDVIATVFPMKLAVRFPDRQALYSEYLKRHKRAMKWTRNRSRWGTYFERLTQFGGPGGPNQLEVAITKLNNWPTRNTTGIVFHLSSAITDSPRTRGGPCWHFGEIIWNPDSSIDLVVVYRNHDFFGKALGNFIALGQLLKFIAGASGKKQGKLVVHSVHAFSQSSLGKLKTLARLPSQEK